MRNTSKTLVGGVLAALLVLSASPAQAFGPQDPVVGTEQEVPVTDPPVIVEDENTDEANQAPENVPQDSPESDETGVADEAPAEEGPADEAPADDAAVAQADAARTVTEAPSTIALSGRLILLPNEPKVTDSAGAPLEDEGLVAGVLLATESGAFIPVDTANIVGAVASGADFAGTATVPASARAAVAAQIVDEGALSEAEMLGTINETILEDQAELAVAGSVEQPVEAASDTPMGAAPAKRTHTADVMFFNSGRNFNDTWIKSLVSQTGSYWKTQSNGAIAGLDVAKYQKKSPIYGECYQDGLWNQAASAFNANGNTYTNGHHLIVIVDSSKGCGGMAGLAGIGTKIHDGGLIWVDIKGWASSDGTTQSAVNKSLATLSHELGHNISLGHSQSRVCSGRTTDAKTAWKADEQNPRILRVLKPSGTTCKDVEYGNTWDLMGTTPGAGHKPVALGLAQRSALGVNPTGSVRTVQASGGRVQNFTLDPMGNNAGLRGLKISNPRGESFYVEYRSNVGQDSAGPGANVIYSADDVTAVTSGVVVSKSYPTAMNKWTDGVWRPYAAKRSTALTTYKTSGSYPNMKHLAMAKDGVSTPISSIARVRVTNVAGGKANVRVEFAPFTDVTYDQKFGKEINWMSSSGISTGSSAGSGLRKYEPKAKVTREAMAAFIYRMENASYKAPGKSPFVDVKPGAPFYREITWMYKAGISTGTMKNGKRYYEPKAGVTREAMSAFMYRVKKATYKGAAKSPFADVPKNHKFYKQISWMKKEGITTGTARNGKLYYDPKASVTREAMAAFMYRMEH